MIDIIKLVAKFAAIIAYALGLWEYYKGDREESVDMKITGIILWLASM